MPHCSTRASKRQKGKPPMDAHPPNHVMMVLMTSQPIGVVPLAGMIAVRRSRFYSKSCASSSDTCTQTAVISDGRRQYHCYTYPRKLLAAFPLNLNVESLTQEAMRNITNIEIWKNGAAGNQHPLEYCFLGIAGCSNENAVNSINIPRKC